MSVLCLMSVWWVRCGCFVNVEIDAWSDSDEYTRSKWTYPALVRCLTTVFLLISLKPSASAEMLLLNGKYFAIAVSFSSNSLLWYRGCIWVSLNNMILSQCHKTIFHEWEFQPRLYSVVLYSVFPGILCRNVKKSHQYLHINNYNRIIQFVGHVILVYVFYLYHITTPCSVDNKLQLNIFINFSKTKPFQYYNNAVNVTDANNRTIFEWLNQCEADLQVDYRKAVTILIIQTYPCIHTYHQHRSSHNFKKLFNSICTKNTISQKINKNP